MSSNGLDTSIGIVWPDSPTILESKEAWSFIPRGFFLHATSPPPDSESGGPITLERVIALAESNRIEIASADLALTGITAISYACTSASYVRGKGGDLDIANRINHVTGIPATTTSTAMINALNHLGIERVAVLSPHIKPLNERLVDFLETGGIQISRITGLDMTGGIDKLDPNSNRSLIVSEVDDSNSDGIFVSCTSMRSATVIDDIERDVGKPVVTAIQATVWDLLRLSGWCGSLQSRGSLMSRNPEKTD